MFWEKHVQEQKENVLKIQIYSERVTFHCKIYDASLLHGNGIVGIIKKKEEEEEEGRYVFFILNAEPKSTSCMHFTLRYWTHLQKQHAPKTRLFPLPAQPCIDKTTSTE